MNKKLKEKEKTKKSMRELKEVASSTFHTLTPWPPVGAPLNLQSENEPPTWTSSSHFDNSVSAVSFGFVATAVLISMFLVMAIFERFLRPPPTITTSTTNGGLDSSIVKFGYQSPKMAVYPKGVSILMPGDDTPTFIAHPAPVPCPAVPQHQHNSSPDSIRGSHSNSIQEC